MAAPDPEKTFATAIDASDLDDAVLKAQGHCPELDRSFSWVGILGLSYTVALSWAGFMCALLAIVSAYGGGQTLIFAVFVGSLGQWVVLLGLAELCSAFPSAGGQYHFTYILSPARIKNFAAFAVGLTNIMGWWTGTASAMIYMALSVFGMVQLWAPGFAPTQWQTYLLYVLVTLISMTPIFLIPHRQYDNLTKTCLAITITVCVTIIVVPLAMGAGHFQAANLVTFRGISGWAPGVAWMLSIANSGYAFAAVGCVTHLAEEMPRPGKNLPLVINAAMAMGILTTLPVSIIMVGTLTDTAAIQRALLPSLEAFYQATGSKVAATVLQVLLTIAIFSSFPGLWVTNGRVAWAFSRDNGLPCSTYFSRVSSRFHFPIRTTLLAAVFIVIYGVVYIASTQAFNAIVNTSTLLLNLTFTVPQMILLCGRRKYLPPRHFDLGRYGYAVNLFSGIWMVVMAVLLLFPQSYPTSAGSMNYGSAVIGAFALLILVIWIERRGHFSGPEIDWERLGGLNKQD